MVSAMYAELEYDVQVGVNKEDHKFGTFDRSGWSS